MKTRGFTIIELLMAIAIGTVVLAVSIPNLFASRKRGNEAAAIGALKTVANAQAVFREGDKEQDGNLDYGMLSELVAVGLVDPVLQRSSYKGYVFEGCYSYVTSEFLWFAMANPRVPTHSGDRYFETNQAGVIFYSTTSLRLLDTSTCSLPNNGVRPGCRHGR